MKLSETILAALISQFQMELGSAYLYRSMAHDMKHRSLPGYAAWLTKQYEEEREHAFKILDYIEARDGVANFLPIEGVMTHYTCPLEVAKASLAHEEKVSASIRKLFLQAREEGDLETELFLQWFVTEQVEEETNAKNNVDGFAKAKDCDGLLYMFDAQLAKR